MSNAFVCFFTPFSQGHSVRLLYLMQSITSILDAGFGFLIHKKL